MWLSDVQMLEYEMATNADKLKSIVDQGKEMAAAGHFDSASILRAVQDFDKRLYFSSAEDNFVSGVVAAAVIHTCR